MRSSSIWSAGSSRSRLPAASGWAIARRTRSSSGPSRRSQAAAASLDQRVLLRRTTTPPPGPAAGSLEARALKRAVAPADEDGDGAELPRDGVVCDRQVSLAVAVQVADRDGKRGGASSARVVGLRPEGAVAVVDQHGNGARTVTEVG